MIRTFNIYSFKTKECEISWNIETRNLNLLPQALMETLCILAQVAVQAVVVALEGCCVAQQNVGSYGLVAEQILRLENQTTKLLSV